MKKVLLCVSCVAALLVVSNMSVAQDAVSPACSTPVVVQGIALPLNHPGLGVNHREFRRITAVQGRIATRQMNIEARHAVPQLQFPFQPGAAGANGFAFADTPSVPNAVFQTGRFNSNSQRVTANNVPVFNVMSIVRGPQPLHPPYYAPVAAE